mgnify:CR=1 FL=1
MGSVDAGFQDQETEWQLPLQVIRSADDRAFGHIAMPGKNLLDRTR